MGNGELSMSELRELFKAASTQYPYFEDYVTYLEEAAKGFEEGVTNEAPQVQALHKMFTAAESKNDGALPFFGELAAQRVSTQRIKRDGGVQGVGQRGREVAARLSANGPGGGATRSVFG